MKEIRVNRSELTDAMRNEYLLKRFRADLAIIEENPFDQDSIGSGLAYMALIDLAEGVTRTLMAFFPESAEVYLGEDTTTEEVFKQFQQAIFAHGGGIIDEETNQMVYQENS